MYIDLDLYVYVYVFIFPCVSLKFWTGTASKEMLLNSIEYVDFIFNNEYIVL